MNTACMAPRTATLIAGRPRIVKPCRAARDHEHQAERKAQRQVPVIESRHAEEPCQPENGKRNKQNDEYHHLGPRLPVQLDPEFCSSRN